MKVCLVTMNSVWWEPRVRKQISAYSNESDIDLVCVGFKDQRYEEEKISAIPCKIIITTVDDSLAYQQKSFSKKLKRDAMTYYAIRDAIISESPDIIHADDLKALVPAYSAAKKLKCKLIYDSFEINVENYTGKRQNLMAELSEKIERNIVRKVDAMISVSNAAAEYFEKKYKIKKPMVITNCVRKKDIVKEPVEKVKYFEILNHGQFYDGRGYDIMAEANKLLKEYPDIHLAIRGFGKLEPILRDIVYKNENTDHFHFYPKVTVDELIPMAAYSHVGVAITEPICLNFKLSVSNKLFEYAAAGLPVILSNIPEHRILNEKYNFGVILEADTPDAFAKAAIKLYEDNKLYATLSANAKKMSEELNWENEFKQLIEYERGLV